MADERVGAGLAAAPDAKLMLSGLTARLSTWAVCPVNPRIISPVAGFQSLINWSELAVTTFLASGE